MQKNFFNINNQHKIIIFKDFNTQYIQNNHKLFKIYHDVERGIVLDYIDNDHNNFLEKENNLFHNKLLDNNFTNKECIEYNQNALKNIEKYLLENNTANIYGIDSPELSERFFMCVVEQYIFYNYFYEHDDDFLLLNKIDKYIQIDLIDLSINNIFLANKFYIHYIDFIYNYCEQNEQIIICLPSDVQTQHILNRIQFPIIKQNTSVYKMLGNLLDDNPIKLINIYPCENILTSTNFQQYIEYFQYNYTNTPYSYIQWESNCISRGNSFISLYAYMNNCSYQTAISEIINKYKKKFEKSDITLYKSILLNHNYIFSMAQRYGFKYCNSYPIYKTKNEIGAYIFEFNYKDFKFYVQTYLSNNEFVFQYNKEQKRLFLNHEKFIDEEYIDCDVVLFQDMRAAIEFQKTNYYNTNIITAHLDQSLKKYDWTFFANRDVYFICAPSVKYMARVKGYYDILKNIVSNFKIYPWFILPYDEYDSYLSIDISMYKSSSIFDNDDNECESYIFKEENLSDNEKKILKESGFILNGNKPGVYKKFNNYIEISLQEIKNESISYQDYIEWGYNLGIFKRPNILNENEVLKTSNLLKYSRMLPPDDISKVSIQHLFARKKYTFIYGAKDVGKSYVCLSIVSSIINNNKLFNMFNIENTYGNILYIDGETEPSILRARLEQFNIDIEDKSKNNKLFLLSKIAGMEGGNKLSFNLFDDNFLGEIKKFVTNKSYKCKYIVIDNLTTLASGEIYNTQNVSKLFNKLDSFQELDVCLIIIHHADESKSEVNSRMRGSDEFHIRAHTEIFIIDGKQYILNNNLFDKKNGLNIGIYFNVCKSAAILKNKYFWLHLPFNKKEFEYLGETDELINKNNNLNSKSCSNDKNDFINQKNNEFIDNIDNKNLEYELSSLRENTFSEDSIYYSLFGNDKIIIDYALNNNLDSIDKYFKNSDIRKLLNIGDAGSDMNKIRLQLFRLVERNILYTCGENKGKKYWLNKETLKQINKNND